MENEVLNPCPDGAETLPLLPTYKWNRRHQALGLKHVVVNMKVYILLLCFSFRFLYLFVIYLTLTFFCIFLF